MRHLSTEGYVHHLLLDNVAHNWFFFSIFTLIVLHTVYAILHAPLGYFFLGHPTLSQFLNVAFASYSMCHSLPFSFCTNHSRFRFAFNFSIVGRTVPIRQKLNLHCDFSCDAGPIFIAAFLYRLFRTIETVQRFLSFVESMWDLIAWWFLSIGTRTVSHAWSGDEFGDFSWSRCLFMSASVRYHSELFRDGSFCRLYLWCLPMSMPFYWCINHFNYLSARTGMLVFVAEHFVHRTSGTCFDSDSLHYGRNECDSSYKQVDM
jgi:hypothetical protein